MNDEVLFALLSCRPIKIKAVLHDYACRKVVGEDYPGIRPEKGSRVEGLLIQQLTASQIALLDNYEGEYYQRCPVTVMGKDNTSLSCETYVFKPEYYQLLSNDYWSNEDFRQHRLQEFLAACFDPND